MPWLVRVRAFCLLGNKACRDGSNDAGGRQYFLPIVWTIRMELEEEWTQYAVIHLDARYYLRLRTESEWYGTGCLGAD